MWTQFATSSRRLTTDSIDKLETGHSGLITWILIDIDNVFSNDVRSLRRHLSVQEIVNWVTTADGCVAAFTPPTRLSSTVESRRRRCVLGTTTTETWRQRRPHVVNVIGGGVWNSNMFQDGLDSFSAFQRTTLATSFQHNIAQNVGTTCLRKDAQRRRRNSVWFCLCHSTRTISRREGISGRQWSQLATFARFTYYFR